MENNSHNEGGPLRWLTISFFVIMLIMIVWRAVSLLPPGALQYGFNPFESTYEESNTEGCSSDCSGHNAGYNWASQKGITDPDDCAGKSGSFIEGCKDYANQQGSNFRGLMDIELPSKFK